MSDEKRGQERIGNPEMEALYAQLSQSAARLMVVHEAGNILRSTHDREELAQGLLSVIAEAVFAQSGCVASLDGDELRILATRGLEDHEADGLASNPNEAAVWFAVSEADVPRRRDSLAEELDLGGEDEFVFGDDDAPEEGTDDDWSPPDEDEPTADEDDDLPTDDDELPADEDDDLPTDDDELPADDDDDDEPAQDHARAPVFELYVPLRVEDDVLGVLALGHRVDGKPLSFEDEQLANSLSSHLSLALAHAALFDERGRRIEQLSALLRISKEITSTLDLERVLTTIAHMVGLVLPNRATTVALVAGDKISIRASSDPAFNLKDAEKSAFLPVLRWVNGARQPLNTCRGEMDGDTDADGRDVILPWLSREDGAAGLAVLPLEDDQGILGLLAVETEADAPPMDDDTEELVTILANQTTVAIRNAELYQRIPMIGVVEPFLAKARQTRRGGSRKLAVRLGVIAAVLAVGFLLPLPSWVSGDATLRPSWLAAVRAGTEGTVDEVLVVEGQEISEGTVVARLRRDEIEMELEKVRAAAQRSRAEAARARSQGDLAGYRGSQADINQYFEAEKYLEDELSRTEIAAPTGGIVLTPRVELRRGAHLARGETFLELASLASMDVEVDVSEANIEKVATGSGARLKVHAYPHQTFRGEIVRISPRADAAGVFRVTARIENEEGALRPGMTGRAHLTVPAEPVLRKWLRPLARRIRLKSWF